jgi:phosphopantetheine--protein transferase-like protein
VHAVSPVDATAPLLHTGRGAPHLPAGIAGSISHKRRRAIAIAAAEPGLHLGIDLEERPTVASLERPSIARRILTERELDALASLDALAHREATLLHFALKEAVYKAIDPTVHRYVRFTEVELDVHPDGRARVTLLLPETVISPLHVDAHWMRDADYIVAMASCRATPPAR